MEDKALAYFSGINPLAKRILEDCKKVETEYADEWHCWDLARKEQILDDFLIHSFVKDRYSDQNSAKEQIYPESFPKLSVSCGEKIIVDFDNDCWTWQDEHSGPFSWKTKSQQDLSIKDLGASELKKSKTSSKFDSSSAGTPRNGSQKIRDGPRKPGVSKRIWESPFHVVERKGDSGYPSSQDSIQSSFDDVRQSLDLESREDSALSALNSGGETEKAYNSVSKPAVLQISQSNGTSGSNSKRTVRSPLKSPIVSRLPLSPSINKRAIDGTDDTSVVLLEDNKRDSVGQDNAAFVNLLDGEGCDELPVTGPGPRADRGLRGTGEWSTFVGESSSDTLSSGISSPSRRPLISSRDEVDQPINELDGATNQAVEQQSSDHLLPSQEPEHAENQTNRRGLVKSGFDFLDNW